MSLSTLDKIKLKTQQILVKTDDYFTTTKNGMDASHHGVMFGAAAVTAGILGVAAIVTTAPALPFIGTVAALASIPTFTIGGAAVNLAGATLLGGGSAGIAFTAFAKMYKAVKGDRDYYVNGEFECWTKGSNNTTGELVKVDRKEILKDVENGTFSQKYDAIKISAPENPKGYNRFIVPENNSLEVTATLPYKIYDKEIVPNGREWEDDCKKVRRECFKEAKKSDLKASIMNRISGFREKIDGISEKKKYTI